YLWSYRSNTVYGIAFAGSILLLISLMFFIIMIKEQWPYFAKFNPTARHLVTISITTFFLKTLLQIFLIIPIVGEHVFSNRAIIIGFLHLVLLGFVSIYLLAHFIQSGRLVLRRLTISAAWLFVIGVFLNEVVLFGQGLGLMLMHTSQVTPWLLFGTAACLFCGAFLITIGQLKYSVLYFLSAVRNRNKNILST